jgi:alpha-2-macroglobulin
VYREPAVNLLAANAILPGDELTHKLAARLLAGMSPEGNWTSTSDTGWSLAALSEYFSGGKTDAKPIIVKVRQGSVVDETFTLEPTAHRTIALDPREFLKNPYVKINANSEGTMLYRLAVTFPRTDYARNGYSNGFEVHKTVRNTDGSNAIRVGDIVEVKLKINIKNHRANYVVVDDPLPAGFVAINSAIKTEEAGLAVKKLKRAMRSGDDEEEGDGDDGEFGEGFEWSDYYWNPGGFYQFTPNFLEMRNDRVLAFRNKAWGGVYEYSYYARAVCEGEFVLPSTKVQLMYDPDVVAYTPQGKVVIKERQEVKQTKK